MGGLKITPDLSLDEVNIHDISVLVLPGGDAWEAHKIQGMDDLVEQLFMEKKTIAAICAATTFLGEKGYLDYIRHTSNALDYLKHFVPSYQGEKNYTTDLAVTDNAVITTNGIAPIEFAREVFKKVALYSEEDIEKWYQLFKHGVWSE